MVESLIETKGELAVSLGEGYLSLYEACGLRPGDVVRSRRLAGESHALLYNGTPLAQCEVVVLGRKGGGSVWGVRVSNTDFPGTYAFGPPARKDDVGELVPFMIRLGSIRVSLGELGGVARNSLIGLGKPWSETADAELVVAGLPVARGKVVVIDEEMGLRVTQVLAGPCETALVGTSGYLLDTGAQTGRLIKNYDFRRPDKVTRPFIDRIRDIHILFLRNLRARIPRITTLLGDLAVPEAVDQCTLGEAWAVLEGRGIRGRLVVENRSWRPPPRTASPGVLPVRPILEEQGTTHPVDPVVRTLMEKYLGEQGLVNRSALFVAHGPEVAREGPERDAFLASLRDAWRNYADLNLVASTDAGSLMSENEMVVIVTFGPRLGEPVLALVYPYLTLEPYARVLSA